MLLMHCFIGDMATRRSQHRERVERDGVHSSLAPGMRLARVWQMGLAFRYLISRSKVLLCFQKSIGFWDKRTGTSLKISSIR